MQPWYLPSTYETPGLSPNPNMAWTRHGDARKKQEYEKFTVILS